MGIDTTGASPTITTTGGPITGLDYFFGSGPSTGQSFNVSGVNLTDDITVTAPANFELAENLGGPYGPSVTLMESSGTVTSTPVFERSMHAMSRSFRPRTGRNCVRRRAGGNRLIRTETAGCKCRKGLAPHGVTPGARIMGQISREHRYLDDDPQHP